MKVLVNNFLHHLRLYVVLLGYNFQSRLAYRGEFILMLISVTAELSVRLIFLSLIYAYVPTLAGWTYPNMLLLIATGLILEACAWFTWRGSILKLHLAIQDGSFDFLMTKPVSLLFITAMRRMDLEDVVRIFLGIGLIFRAIQLQQFTPSVDHWIFWLVSLFLAQIVYFSFALILKTTSFWTTQTSEINYVLFSLDRLNQYPTQIYSGIIRIFFTFIIPVTFITTLPAEFITGKASWDGLIGLVIFTCCIFLLARKFFYFAIQTYSSSSS